MKSTARTAALAFGLTLAGTWSFGSSTARAQSFSPTVPARTLTMAVPRATVATVPRHVGVSPNYYFTTPSWAAPGWHSSPYVDPYNYESARRGLKLYKPWLQH